MADQELTVNREFFPEGTDYRAFYEAMITSADVGLLMVDKEGNFRLVNPALQAMMAQAFPDGHQGSAGQTGDLYTEDGITEVPYEMLPSVRATRGEEFEDYFIWMGRDPEHRRALLLSCRMMRLPDGSTDGAVVVTRDVTEVTRAVRAREDFLATISHELRTPLASLLGYLELAIDDTVDGPTADLQSHLATAQRNGARLLRLVDELLGAATLAHGVRLSRTEVDLRALVERTVAAAELPATEAGLDLSFSSPPLPPVELDEDRITEVLENLLTNAIKFTPAGGRVEVSCEAGTDGVSLRVRDTGVGIDPADREAVFDRFFRASNALKQAIQGVGLGLHVVKVIVEAHGGRITADANPDGPGTDVVVTLPIGAASTQTD